MNRIIIAAILLFACLTSNGQKAKVDTLFMQGPSDKLINLVFLGDGYTEAELAKFLINADSLAKELLTQTPFVEYANHFNAFAISTASNESGAAPDPNNLIDNYYGSTFGYGGIDRLLVPTKTNNVTSILADNLPSYDQVFMVVNSDKYGGSGGWIATSSINSAAPEIAIHEIGHSFAGLADEYWAGAQYAREKPNMTQTTDTSKVKWNNWLGFNDVGIYAYPSPGNDWYRPHQGCKMQYLNYPFCPVCRETIVEKILSLTSPIMSTKPASDTTTTEDEIVFELNLLKPTPNSLEINWFVDGEQNENDESYTLKRADISNRSANVKATILDTTGLSRVDNSMTFRLSTVEWKVEFGWPSNISQPKIEEFEIKIYPNPATSYLVIESGIELETIQIIDSKGSVNQLPLINGKVDISNLASGVYTLQMSVDGQIISKRFVKE